MSGCATLQTQAPDVVQNKNMSWDKRTLALSNIQTWDLKAIIAVRQQQQAFSANLQWQQQQQDYHISLFGPLGTNSYELTGHPGHVQLAAADGKKYTADSPEQLLTQQAGWTLPVSNLFYWIRGLPAPNLPNEKHLDAFNHLIELKQEGWNIHYLRYTTVNQIDIPSKIFLDNPMMNVKIVISQWQI